VAFRIEIAHQAERDSEEILEWLLAQKGGQAGIDWFLALDHAFASLERVSGLVRSRSGKRPLSI
jgi:hypothetical protein